MLVDEIDPLARLRVASSSCPRQLQGGSHITSPSPRACVGYSLTATALKHAHLVFIDEFSSILSARKSDWWTPAHAQALLGVVATSHMGHRACTGSMDHRA